ncbi:hypothetical protein MKZ17_20390 [Solibacillus sp. FSL R7-0682]|jgi:hypothetical protein|uniref:hypothetical protein n=1 Tax=Solibacillus sp. FSL R7-0682 TaxID=2921690 RepID=UPI0030FC3FE9
MKKNQLSYFAFPVIFFIVLTIKQFFSNSDIKWSENLIILAISCVLIYLFVSIYNWAKKPYSWKKN